MTLILFMDTETQGLPDYHQPSEAAHQPHMVELAAKLYDTVSRQVVEELDTLIRPDGWIVSEDATAIHGITHEQALAQGIPEPEALSFYLDMHNMCDFRVAHNESFDARIIRIAIKRFGHGSFGWNLMSQEEKDELADEYRARPALCTMWTGTPHTKLPPTGKMRAARRYGFKNPNLGELHEHFCGEPFHGAHRAMTDVDGVMRCYLAMHAAGIDLKPRTRAER